MSKATLPSDAVIGDDTALGNSGLEGDRELVQSILAESEADADSAVPGTRRRNSGRLRRAGRKPGLFRRWRPRLSLGVLRRRPNWQEITLGALLTWFLLDPVRVASIFLLIVCSCILLCYAIGAGRVGRLLARGHARIAKRNPARAERLRSAAERLVDAVAELASWLPEYWTDGLYLPDLSRNASADDDIAFQRMARMRSEG